MVAAEDEQRTVISARTGMSSPVLMARAINLIDILVGITEEPEVAPPPEDPRAGAAKAGKGPPKEKREKKVQKRKTKNVGDDLARALEDGWIDLSLGSLSQADLVELIDKIRLTPKPLAGIRLAVVAKGYDDLLGDMASGAMVLSSRPYDFTSNKHAQAQDAFRDALKSEKYRTKFATLLQRMIGMSNVQKVQELSLCFPLPKALPKPLGLTLQTYTGLRVLNLSGSRIGDRGMMEIVAGLRPCKSLRRLILAGCGLTDFAASALSGLIKGYNANREVRVWEANLRTYPPLPMSAKLRRRMQWTVNHDAYTQVLDDGANAGGLHFLDLSCNALTDTAISELLDAIIADFKMVGLSLRRNAISPAGVKRMREVLNPDDADLTKCHRSLVFVDMRFQGDGTRVDDPSSVVLVNPLFAAKMPRKTGVQASLATHDMPGSRPPSRLDARPGSVSPTPTPRPATATAAGPGPTPRVARPASAPRLAVATPRGAEVARSAGLLRPSTARGQGAKGSGAGVRGGGGAATTDAKPAQLSARGSRAARDKAATGSAGPHGLTAANLKQHQRVVSGEAGLDGAPTLRLESARGSRPAEEPQPALSRDETGNGRPAHWTADQRGSHVAPHSGSVPAPTAAAEGGVVAALKDGLAKWGISDNVSEGPPLAWARQASDAHGSRELHPEPSLTPALSQQLVPAAASQEQIEMAIRVLAKHMDEVQAQFQGLLEEVVHMKRRERRRRRAAGVNGRSSARGEA